MSAAEQSHDSLIRRLSAVCHERGVNFIAQQPIGETPYGQPFKADLVLDGLPQYPDLVIIARQQDKSGSAEQKLPFLMMAINRSRRRCLMVLDGEGWSPGALGWMAARKDDRLIGVVDLDGFDTFLAMALRG